MEPCQKSVLEGQLTSAIDQYQFFAGQLVQSLGFVIAADAILLGYGVNSRVSGALLLASMMPVVMLLIRIEFGRHAIIAAYVAIRLERLLDIDADSLMLMQIATRYPMAFAALLKVIDMEGQDLRIRTIRKGIRRRSVAKDADTVVFLSAALIQIGLFFFALLGLGRPIL